MGKTTAVMNVVPDVVMARKIYLSVKEELLHPDDNNTGMGHLAQQFRKHCCLMPHHIKNPLSCDHLLSYEYISNRYISKVNKMICFGNLLLVL